MEDYQFLKNEYSSDYKMAEALKNIKENISDFEKKAILERIMTYEDFTSELYDYYGNSLSFISISNPKGKYFDNPITLNVSLIDFIDYILEMYENGDHITTYIKDISAFHREKIYAEYPDMRIGRFFQRKITLKFEVTKEIYDFFDLIKITMEE